ncbi:glycoside hydrolase family 53 protein [Alicyclobacillus mengziensis]|uniref:Arabinogalactan endo-beta-1,4-galactanase n=1 Tax=Alicyclobacillus mengziensis TaxID=2931921 RepID=A0A9X7VZK7_9BACL|nr:glycosyl hydrolase 53 family protein [Alicyclobacillus mengziensis]QSO47412.1 glycosyl hydrolase 53 family protein [Alicyclobacillus mengziensis]
MIRKFLSGADVSFLDEIEQKGGKFYEGNVEDGCLSILKRHGMNAVRLRVWNDPKDGYCSVENTLRMARRLKETGFVTGIDFHYSDWWADPGKQYKPKAWENLSFDELVTSVYDFTYNVLNRLKEQGTPADFVQIGNEVTYGMLWEDGRLPGPNDEDNPESWKRFARLMKSGNQAARDCQGQEVNLLLHIDRGGDNVGARFFLDHVIREGVEFDSIGLSYYPWWHGPEEALKENLDDLATRYNKDIILVETAFPWTDVQLDNAIAPVDASPENQKMFLQTVMDIVDNVPNGRGLGVFYWEPDAISTGEAPQGWSKLSLFDSKGRMLPGVEVFNRLR